MPLWIAWPLVVSLQVYLAVGLVVAVALELRGLARLDAAVTGSSWGFRFVIFPGLVALWPLFLRRWVLGSSEPPEERNAHRNATRGARP